MVSRSTLSSLSYCRWSSLYHPLSRHTLRHRHLLLLSIEAHHCSSRELRVQAAAAVIPEVNINIHPPPPRHRHQWCLNLQMHAVRVPLTTVLHLLLYEEEVEAQSTAVTAASMAAQSRRRCLLKRQPLLGVIHDNDNNNNSSTITEPSICSIDIIHL